VTADAAGMAAVLTALAEIPTRVAALEHQVAAMTSEMRRVRATMPTPLVSVPQAAAAYGVSVPTIRRWVKRGRIPSVKVGNTVRVDLSRVKAADDHDIARLARGTTGGGPGRG
jgi:excisionase family DNA binding protein